MSVCHLVGLPGDLLDQLDALDRDEEQEVGLHDDDTFQHDYYYSNELQVNQEIVVVEGLDHRYFLNDFLDIIRLDQLTLALELHGLPKHISERRQVFHYKLGYLS